MGGQWRYIISYHTTSHHTLLHHHHNHTIPEEEDEEDEDEDEERSVTARPKSRIRVVSRDNSSWDTPVFPRTSNTLNTPLITEREREGSKRGGKTGEEGQVDLS